MKSVDVSHADGSPAHATPVPLYQPYGSGHCPGAENGGTRFSFHATTLDFEQSTTALTEYDEPDAVRPASTDTSFGSASARDGTAAL